MSIIKVQCKGSGQNAKASLNAKRSICPYCGHLQDLRNDGKFRNHKRVTRTSKLKRGRKRK